MLVKNSKPSSYASYKNFGSSLNESLQTKASTWSIEDNIDTYFDIGPLARAYGPQAERSQKYMADKCSLNWDSTCDYLAMNTEQIKGNCAKIMTDNTGYNDTYDLSVGDALVNNSAMRRFCLSDQCTISQELFNPLDPNSPMINNINCRGVPLIYKPPKNPDQDALLNRVLDKPEKHMNILVNMYNNVKDERHLYNGTRIGKLFEMIDVYRATTR